MVLRKRCEKQYMDIGALRTSLKFLLLQYSGMLPSQRLRHRIYKRFYGLKMGRDSVVYNSCELRDPHQITIGDFTSIGDHCILDGRGGLTIGNSVNFSTGVWVWTMEHKINDPDFGSESAPVIIEDYAWIIQSVINNCASFQSKHRIFALIVRGIRIKIRRCV